MESRAAGGGPGSLRRGLRLLPAILALAALDLAVKAWVLDAGPLGVPLEDRGWWALVPSLNRGVAFSLGASGPWGALLAAGGLAVLGLLTATRLGSPREEAPLVLLWGGGLGNLAGRFLHGGVVDYLVLRPPLPVSLPALNLADLFLMGGAALLLLAELRGRPTAPPPG